MSRIPIPHQLLFIDNVRDSVFLRSEAAVPGSPWCPCVLGLLRREGAGLAPSSGACFALSLFAWQSRRAWGFLWPSPPASSGPPLQSPDPPGTPLPRPLLSLPLGHLVFLETGRVILSSPPPLSGEEPRVPAAYQITSAYSSEKEAQQFLIILSNLLPSAALKIRILS